MEFERCIAMEAKKIPMAFFIYTNSKLKTITEILDLEKEMEVLQVQIKKRRMFSTISSLAFLPQNILLTSLILTKNKLKMT